MQRHGLWAQPAQACLAVAAVFHQQFAQLGLAVAAATHQQPGQVAAQKLQAQPPFPVVVPHKLLEVGCIEVQHQFVAAAQQQQLLFQQPGQQLATAVVADEGAPQGQHQQQGTPPWEATVAALQQHFQVPAAQQERFCLLCLRLRAVIEVYTLEELCNACTGQELSPHAASILCAQSGQEAF